MMLTTPDLQSGSGAFCTRCAARHFSGRKHKSIGSIHVCCAINDYSHGNGIGCISPLDYLLVRFRR